MNELKMKLMAALQALHPTMKSFHVDRAVEGYTSAVIKELAYRYLMKSFDANEGEIDFGADVVNKAAGQTTLNGKRERVYTLLQQHASTRLIEIAYEGNSYTGRVSRAIINPKFKDLVMEAINDQDLNLELNSAYLNKLQEQANTDVEVDIQALRSYIDATSDALKSTQSEPGYKRALDRNLLIAKALMSQLKAREDGTTYLREYWETIDSGRVYGGAPKTNHVTVAQGHADRVVFDWR